MLEQPWKEHHPATSCSYKYETIFRGALPAKLFLSVCPIPIALLRVLLLLRDVAHSLHLLKFIGPESFSAALSQTEPKNPTAKQVLESFFPRALK